MHLAKIIFPILMLFGFWAKSQTTLQPSSSITPCIGEYKKAWFNTTYPYDSVQWISNSNQIVSREDTLYITPTLIPSATLYYFDLRLYYNGTSYAQPRLFVLPINSFAFSISDDTTICKGDTASIRVNNPSNQTLRIRWYSSATGFVPPTNNTTTQVRTFRPGRYWVEATNQTETCTLVDTMELATIEQPVALIDDQTICANQSIVLENLNPELPSTTHVWEYNGYTSTSRTLIPTETGTYKLTTRISSNAICEFSDSVNIVINPIPRVDLTPSQTICQGEPFVIQNLLSNPSLSYTTSWESTASLPSIPAGQEVISVNQAGKYKLTLNTGSCSASDSTIVTQFAFEVDLGPNIPDTCTNNGVLLYNLKANTEPNPTFYLWRMPNGNSIQRNIVAKDRGYYYLTVTSDNPQCEVNDSIFVGINPAPTFNLGDDIVEETSFSVYDGTFENQFPEAQFDFVWKGIDNDSIYSTKAMLIIEKPGVHPLSLTIISKTSNCVSSDNITITIPLAPIVASHVIYIPNAISPSAIDSENSKLKILGPDISAENFNLTIYNRWGEVIFETSDFDFITNEGWSGDGATMEAQNGTYTYTTNGEFIDGEPFKKVGTVTILR